MCYWPTSHNSILKTCPKSQVLSFHLSEINDLLSRQLPEVSDFVARSRCQKNTAMRESYAKRVLFAIRKMRAVCSACCLQLHAKRVQFSNGPCFLTRATCKKVWHKSYTSGHCLLLRSFFTNIEKKWVLWKIFQLKSLQNAIICVDQRFKVQNLNSGVACLTLINDLSNPKWRPWRQKNWFNFATSVLVFSPDQYQLTA